MSELAATAAGEGRGKQVERLVAEAATLADVLDGHFGAVCER